MPSELTPSVRFTARSPCRSLLNRADDTRVRLWRVNDGGALQRNEFHVVVPEPTSAFAAMITTQNDCPHVDRCPAQKKKAVSSAAGVQDRAARGELG